MKDEEDRRSASSSPLPVSRGPDGHKYSLSSLPSFSPPLSPPGSSDSSSEKLHLVHDNSKLSNSRRTVSLPSFSLDQQLQPADDSSSQSLSCFRELFEWFVLRCCSCCAWHFNPPSKLHHK